jgi:hypothetical protein
MKKCTVVQKVLTSRFHSSLPALTHEPTTIKKTQQAPI